ncbi:MAG: osmotically inducible protein OsmC [Chloroflexota bacterium]|jgi:osmotically inducible protein OsmC|nr:OsmC family protein [Caldilinea sp.]GIK71081.1 MAG: osmotically inducible protein OsmC [Chloroflexota bacterium]
MPVRKANAIWNGTLKEGSGVMKLGGGAYNGPYTYQSRFEDGVGTNPEELIGAAHAGCFSMFLSALLSKDGFTPESIETTAKVYLEAGPTIAKIELNTTANVPGLDAAKLQEYAEAAKANCPVSKALASVEIVLNAALA